MGKRRTLYELAAQPTEEEQNQEADLGNEPKVELVQDPKVETQEPNLVEPEAQEVPKYDTPELIPGVRRSHRVRTQTKQSYVLIEYRIVMINKSSE